MKQNCLGIFLLMAAIMILTPIASAGPEDMKQAFPENDTAGFVPVDVISIDPAIKAATPYYDLLILSDEGKQTWLENIDRLQFDTNGQTISGDFRNRLKSDLADVWEKYPVDFVTSPGSPGYPTYGGSTITIRFKNASSGARLSDSENAILQRVQVLTNYDYLRSHNLTSPVPSGYPDGIPATQPAPLPPALVIIAICCIAMTKAIRKQRGR